MSIAWTYMNYLLDNKRTTLQLTSGTIPFLLLLSGKVYLMLSDEFNNLTLDERGELPFKQGKYFRSLDLYAKRNKVLYMFQGMIVEVTVNTDTNKVEGMHAWKTIKLISK